MIAAQIQAEIAQLIEVVKYSPSVKANIAAEKIMSLKRKLAEEVNKNNRQDA